MVKKIKCKSEKCKNKDCDMSIAHLSRIEGQVKKLKTYIAEGKDCKDIAMLMKSVSNSFESLRQKTMKNFILNEFGNKVSPEKREKIEKIFNNYKK